MSVEPPGGNGTIRRTGREGYCGAEPVEAVWAGASPVMSVARRSAARPPRRFAPPLLGRRGKSFRLSLRRAKLRRHPVGSLVAVAIPEIVNDVVAAFDHREHAGAGDRGGELLGLRVRSETVLGSRDDVYRAGDVFRALREREAQRHLARFLEVRALGAHAEGLDVHLRAAGEIGGALERAGERHAGFDTLLERGGARRVIAAERYAPDAGARVVDVRARREVIQQRPDPPLVIRAERRVVLRLALTRPV